VHEWSYSAIAYVLLLQYHLQDMTVIGPVIEDNDLLYWCFPVQCIINEELCVVLFGNLFIRNNKRSHLLVLFKPHLL